MANVVTKKQMMDYLTEVAKSYVKDARESVRRNKHMHNFKKGSVSQHLVEAVVVDFINRVGTDQGLDWCLYTHYLHDDAPPPLQGQCYEGNQKNGDLQLAPEPIDLGDLSKRLFDRAKMWRENKELQATVCKLVASSVATALTDVASVFRQASWTEREGSPKPTPPSRLLKESEGG